MKYLISLLFLIFSTNLYAKELLAIVNGNKITTDVVNEEFFNMDSTQKQITIKRLIEKELAIEYALNSQIVKDKKFINTFNHIINKTSQKNKDLASSIKKEKYSKEQLRSKKGLLAFDMILDKKASEILLDTKILEKYYNKNKDKYNTKKMYELLQIIVNDKRTAQNIYEKLQKSQKPIKTFQNIAYKQSLAPTKEKNGYLGQFYYEDMPKTLKKAVKNLKTYQYSKPFLTDFGYQLVFVMGYQDEIKRDYKESQINVKEDYKKEKVINWAFEQIDKLKEKAKIKIVFKD